MKKLTDFKLVLVLFCVWRVATLLVSFLATIVIPKWGGWFPYPDKVLIPTGLPSWIWGFGNFDGVHYLRIAQDGYIAANSQAFFPLYPLLIRFLNIFPKSTTLDTSIYTDPSYFFTGFILANILFIFALYFFYKLVRMDFGERIGYLSLILLLVFPTSYYFGSVYTESLFLLLAASSIFYIRKRNFILGGILAGLASGTRILGIMLFPLLIVEIFRVGRAERVKAWIGAALAPLGAIFYMFYLKAVTGDFLYFLTAQPGFGAERSAKPFILLPQVIYRYFKIFLALPITSMKFFNAGLEFVFALAPLALLIVFWKKMRLSYWIFTLGVLILPTLTGTFSSMPRYALMGFLLFPHIAQKLGKYFIPVSILLGLLGVILIGLFTRGYWVA